MAHLKKSSTSGHLLKNASGHLINDCGGSADCSDCATNCNSAGSLTASVTVGTACTSGGCAAIQNALVASGITMSKGSDCTWSAAYGAAGIITITCVSNQWKVVLADVLGLASNWEAYPAIVTCVGGKPTGTFILLWTPTGSTQGCFAECAGKTMIAVIT